MAADSRQDSVVVIGTRENPYPAPSLSREIEDGSSIEFKVTLAGVPSSRVPHLATQLRWRLGEGSGRALYYVGVRDDGLAVGLATADADASLATLERIATVAGARIEGIEWMRAAPPVWSLSAMSEKGARGPPTTTNTDTTDNLLRVFRVILRRDSASPAWGGGSFGSIPILNFPASPSETIASGATFSADAVATTTHAPHLHAHADLSSPPARVVLVGTSGAGKSTLVAALALGLLDDGRGSARSAVMRHRHELEEGTSSTVGTCWTVGFDAAGVIVTASDTDDISVASAGEDGHDILSFRGHGGGAGASASASASASTSASASNTTSAVTHSAALFDLPGALKYESVLIEGLFGAAPDAALLIIDGSDAALGGVTTRAHAALCAALGVAHMITIVTHADALFASRAHITEILSSIPLATPSLLQLFVSSVTGEGLSAIARALSHSIATPMPPPQYPATATVTAPAMLCVPPQLRLAACVGVFRVLGSCVVRGALVIGGICVAGDVREGMIAAFGFGPLDDGGEVLQRGEIACAHVAGARARDGAVHAGHLGSLSLGPVAVAARRKWLRRGSRVLAVDSGNAAALPALSRALLPSRFLVFEALPGGAAFPFLPSLRKGACSQLIGASGLRVAVTIVAAMEACLIHLEVSPVDYVEEGIAALWGGGGDDDTS